MSTCPFKSAAVTHTGKVRKSNQDAFLRRDDAGLWAVADGMGGHRAGDLASHTVCRALEGVDSEQDLESTIDAVRTALEQANVTLASMNDGARPPGSTVVVLVIRGNEGALAWAGDSRIYRVRDGRAELLTRDHSHVQQLVDEQVIRPDEAESHPMAHLITRAVGIEESLHLDTERVDIRKGDRFLLCSDGLSRLVSREDIQACLDEHSLADAVNALLEIALDGGAPDNVTVLAVECSP